MCSVNDRAIAASAVSEHREQSASRIGALGTLGSSCRRIVVDPRFSTAAAKADHWLPIKPGTDTARLLAWINVFITEDRYDHAYIDQRANGIDEPAAGVEQYTPEWAAEITDLSAEQIRTTARVASDRPPQEVRNRDVSAS